jgi:circadian clock protein KaiC
MARETAPKRIKTGVRNLDAILRGGLPRGNAIIVAGAPGSGKTILAQQISFHNASAGNRVLYLNTLSEPTAKMLRFLKGFTFFDANKLRESIKFTDIGIILRSKGLQEVSSLIMETVQKEKPAIVVIDSFKIFDELAKSREEARKFGYEIALDLMAWECTTFFLGEYGPDEYQKNPLFSVIDGIITVSQRESSGEHQRFLQIVKMRGTAHSPDEHAFMISDTGIEVYAPRVTIKRQVQAEPSRESAPRRKTGIARLDDLLGNGIPLGSSLLVAGAAGTGKTVLLLEFVYRGALCGEKGIIFSFEETPERLRQEARSLGWDFDDAVERGLIEIVFIPQPDIHVEADLLTMHERLKASGARRVAVDSLSVFLHKTKDPQIAREKTFQLASIIQNEKAVGFFATDITYGSGQISRFGVEETVVDGVMLLTASEEGLERKRYVEVYKLRDTDHLKGRHGMVIARGGIAIAPRRPHSGSSRTGRKRPKNTQPKKGERK